VANGVDIAAGHTVPRETRIITALDGPLMFPVVAIGVVIKVQQRLNFSNGRNFSTVLVLEWEVWVTHLRK
jgi:hypothetical protein